MKHLFKALLLFVMIILLASCKGEEMDRVAIAAVSYDSAIVFQSQPLSLKQGDKVYFWTDMDMEYEGNLEMMYTVEIMKDGESIGGLKLDPMNTDIRMNEVTTSLGNATSTRYEGRMTSFNVENTGSYVFNTVLYSNGNPTLKMNKAEFVIAK